MKKIISALLVVTLLLTLALTLTSCGNKPSGKYGNKLFSVTFDGNEITYKALLWSTKGTFEMGEENEIIITWEGDDGKKEELATSATYDKDSDTIKWLGITLEKVEEDK